MKPQVLGRRNFPGVGFCVVMVALFIQSLLPAETFAAKPGASSVDEDAGLLSVRSVDVGKGDAILVKLPDGKVCLIDTGFKETADKVIADLKKWNVKTIDFLLLTHPDKDHIGGFPYILNEFHVKKVIQSLDLRDSPRAARIKAPQTLFKGPGYAMELFAPNSKYYKGENDYSLVAKLTYGSVSFLFTGDVLETSQKEILKADYPLNADVLKVPHHGRWEDTTEEFFKAVAPKYAIITCDESTGEDPDHKTIQVLKDLGATILRSDRNGNIRFRSNGKTLDLKP